MKLLPQAIETEKAILGAILLEKNALPVVVNILTPDVFYKESHQLIYKACQELFRNDIPIDLITVVNKLQKNGDLEVCGGSYYLAQLANGVASAANIEYHSRILQQKWIGRELIAIGDEIVKRAYDETEDVFDLMDSSSRQIIGVNDKIIATISEKVEDKGEEILDKIKKIRSGEMDVYGLKTGLTKLDTILGGLQKKQLIVIAGRPGMGKSALALSIARNICDDFGSVVLFSLEMSQEMVINRWLVMQLGIPYEALTNPRLLKDQDVPRIEAMVQGLKHYTLDVIDRPAITIAQLRARVLSIVQKKSIDLIIVDYMQLMGSDDKRGSRENEVSEMSRGLKALAMELDIPVIALSQLSRKVEDRTDKTPKLSDLRESGAIEQDADIVMFCFRPIYYSPHSVDIDKQLAEVSIGKNRNGRLGVVPLKFVDFKMEFTDYVENDDQEPVPAWFDD